MAIRIVTNVGPSDRMAVCPIDKNLIVVQKCFASPSDAELYKQSWDTISIGDPPLKIEVTLLSVPAIPLTPAATVEKRMPGRPKKS